MRQQAGPVLGECRLLEGTASGVQVEEPPEEHVVGQPFAELALRAHGGERARQARLQQVFGRRGGPTSLGVHAVEGGRQLLRAPALPAAWSAGPGVPEGPSPRG